MGWLDGVDSIAALMDRVHRRLFVIAGSKAAGYL
jgi:hypothetical protein